MLMGVTKLVPEEMKGGRAVICSDSESVIEALASPVTTSKLVRELKGTLNRLGLRNQITIAWVPGQSGVDGNERADELARQGSASANEGPEPHIPIPHYACEKAVEDWVRAESAKSWSAYSGGEHTKLFFPAPDKKWAKALLRMDRSGIRRVVGAITGHCGLNKHLARMTILADPRCSCGLEEETGIHIICECPKFHLLRSMTLGSCVIQPSEVPGLGPVVLDRFLVRTGRFQ